MEYFIIARVKLIRVNLIYNAYNCALINQLTPCSNKCLLMVVVRTDVVVVVVVVIVVVVVVVVVCCILYQNGASHQLIKYFINKILYNNYYLFFQYM